MDFSIAFLNCGSRRNPDWGAIASTLYAAVGNLPHVVGLCEVRGPEAVARVMAALTGETGKFYDSLVSKEVPGAPGLAVLIDTGLGHLYPVGDDGAFRHGREWCRWLAGRVELFVPGTKTPSPRQLVVVVNHWPSMARGRQDTMADREILAWEVGRWMCCKDPAARQVVRDAGGHPVPVYRQPSVVMGDFNCEPGSPEMRSRRKFTLQAMRTEPQRWNPFDPERDTRALLYDLAWRRLAAGPAPTVPGTFDWKDDLHSPAMIDRVLVSQSLWNGPGLGVALDGDKQAMRIIPAEKKCSDHSAVAITVRTT